VALRLAAADHRGTMANPADQEFLQHAEACMQAILTKLDAFDPDELEGDLSAGVLRITLADSRNCILTRQSAAHQIWLAEGASAWHFARDAVSGAWRDTKGRGELLQILNGIVSRRLGRPIDLAAGGGSGRGTQAPRS
jgi:CyaY protein